MASRAAAPDEMVLSGESWAARSGRRRGDEADRRQGGLVCGRSWFREVFSRERACPITENSGLAEENQGCPRVRRKFVPF